MWDTVGAFSGWNAVVTSPLARCADFANSLGAARSIPVKPDPRLKEGAVGEWEGMSPKEICAHDPLRLFQFKSDPINHGPAGGEPVAKVHARVGAVWQEMLQEFYGQHILVVAHAGIIRMMLSHALGLPVENIYRIQVGNASLTRIQVEHHGEASLATLIFHDGKL